MIVLNNKTCILLERLKVFSPMTYEHSVNVSNLALLFGERLGLDVESIEKLKIAGLLHDIGKLKIPDSILHKPTKLTKEEYLVIKKHPLYGVNILIEADFKNKEILEIILYHHERQDGLGYPYGLTENLIPTLAQILSICDCFDAMYAQRCYKNADDLEKIKQELITNAGTQFNSFYVHLCLAY